MATNIIKLKNKEKIIIDYPIKEPYCGYEQIDLDKVVVNVFLKNGDRIYQEQIKSVTFRARRDSNGEDTED
jgi:hypothetical protein